MPYHPITLSLTILILSAAPAARGQLPDYPDDSVIGIPVNYTESGVGSYELPDPLMLASGAPVKTPGQWRDLRRPELHRLIELNQFGHAPGKPAGMTFEVTEGPTPAFDGAALREQVTIRFGAAESAPWLDLLIYVPAEHDGPAPLLLSIGFMPNNRAVDDPAAQVGRVWNRESRERVPARGPGRFGRLPVRQIISRGFGLATFNYADVEIDAKGAIQHGVRGLLLNEDQTELNDDQWGAIAAWAWGVSRVMDYFETDELVDADRVAVTGISRLGKTALWAGADDQRIAAVIASCSGEGGAALSRRDYGETIAHLASPERYAYQFAKNYQAFAPDPRAASFDSHGLIALVAPRPLLLQTGSTDKWSDPMGEFLAARAATPVYELLGESGVDQDHLPNVDEAVGGTLTFYMHDGGHGMVPADWTVFLDFLHRHLAE